MIIYNNHTIFITLGVVATVLVVCNPTGHVDKRNGIVLFYKLIK